MSLRSVKYVTLAAPMTFLICVEAVQYIFLPHLRLPWFAYIVVTGVALGVLLVFNETIFGIIGRIQRHQMQQYHELLALHEAGLDIAEEVDLNVLLQRVVDRAGALIGANCSGIALVGENGTIDTLVAAGLLQDQRVSLWEAFCADAVFDHVVVARRRVRLEDVARLHPTLGPMVAVPILSRDQVLGAFFLARMRGAARFRAEDEETMERFATQAALAIQNARLQRLIRELAISEERARIAREMHDNLAQLLGYVNTKAQAAQELLRTGQIDRTMLQMSQLAQAARDAYADVRESILGLRSSLHGDRGFVAALREYLERWHEQYGIRVDFRVDVTDEDIHALPATAELQLLRIAQEALSNVRKHSGAYSAEVRIATRDGALEVLIADNGRGFDPDAVGWTGVPRFGLAGMRERAEAVGGELSIWSQIDEGTRIWVRLPSRRASTVASYAHSHR